MQKKLLEINPTHPLVEGLLEKVQEYGDASEEALKDEDLSETVNILYDTSLVRSGFTVREPSEYFSRVEAILRRSLGVSESAKAKVDVKPAPPVEQGPVKPRADKAFDAGMPGMMEGSEWLDWAKSKYIRCFVGSPLTSL
jgi:heat shock protein beta